METSFRTATRLALACVLAALTAPAAASADISVGAADDHPKFPELSERFYDTMQEAGLTENRMAILWDPAHPTTIDGREAIEHAIELATARGVRITLAIYPLRARAITEAPLAGGQFVTFVQSVARAFPQVKDFIIGNEPNKARFWQPQFNPNGAAVACSSYEPLLAASYDALKAVDRTITVIGVGLGPKGTDNARASGNLSISPVRCIRDMGRAYRASRRTRTCSATRPGRRTSRAIRTIRCRRWPTWSSSTSGLRCRCARDASRPSRSTPVGWTSVRRAGP